MRFDDVLITSDYDYTLTAADRTVHPKNIEAIRYFMENGGTFTVNTGRSAVAAKALMEQIPVNAPFLLYNGSASCSGGAFSNVYPIELEPWSILNRLAEEFPSVVLEVQGLHSHYIVNATQQDREAYAKLGWTLTSVKPGDDLGVFVKFNVLAERRKEVLEDLRKSEEENIALFDRIQQRIEELWGDYLTVFRAGVVVLNVHAKGVSKAKAARDLQKQLGKKILVCIGDAENDLSMMEDADFAYCPADGTLADRFETVCNCGEGAVADVIYKKIPEILKNRS